MDIQAIICSCEASKCLLFQSQTTLLGSGVISEFTTEKMIKTNKINTKALKEQVLGE